MGFLSSIFGWGDKPTTTSTQVRSTIPEEMKPYVEEVLTDTQELYRQRMKEGYDPYTGKTIADFTPEELEAHAGLKGLVGSQEKGFDEALDLTRRSGAGYDVEKLGGLDPALQEQITERFGDIDFAGGPERFTSERFQEKDISEYMSPYQRAVTDMEKRKAKEEFDKTMPDFERKAIAAGGLSGLGSRAGVAEAELRKGQAQLIADIEARGLQASFADAQKQKAFDLQKHQDQRAFEERQREFQKGERKFQTGERRFDVGERQYQYDIAKGERDFQKGERTFEADQFAKDRAREIGSGTAIANLTGGKFKSGLSELGLLSDIGETKRDMGQTGLDEAYAKYMAQKQYPEQQLARYQSSIYGNPILSQPNYTKTGTSTKYSPGMGKTLMGLGASYLMGGGGGGGMGGGGGWLGNLFKAGGGRLSGISGLAQATPYLDYIKRNMGGTVKPVVYRQQSGAVAKPSLRDQLAENLKRQAKINAEREARARGGASQAEISNPTLPSVNLPGGSEIDEFAASGDQQAHAQMEQAAAAKAAADKKRLEMAALLRRLGAGKSGVGGLRDVTKSGVESLISPSKIIKEMDTSARKDTKEYITKMERAEQARNKEEKAYQKTYETNIKELNLNPYAEQQFRATILAATLKEGNPIANALTGYKEALDNLSLDEKEKRKNLMSLEDKLLAQKDKSSSRKMTQELNRLKVDASMKEYIRGLPAKQQEMALKLIKESAAGISSLAKLKKAMKSEYSFKPSDTLARWTNYITTKFKGFATNDEGNIVVDKEFYGPDSDAVKEELTEVLAAADIMSSRGVSAGQVSGEMAKKLTTIYRNFLEKKKKREEEGS